MAKEKKSFLLYCDLIYLVNELDNETAGELFIHILKYVNDENPETNNPLVKIAFVSIKQQLKRDLKKYEGIREKNKENALKRWNKNDATASERIPSNTKNAVTVIDIVNDTDKDTIIKKSIEDRKSAFYKSLIPFEKLYGKILLREFFDYWAEHGDNDKKMRFEKEKSFGLVRRLQTWKKREKNEFSKNSGPNKARSIEQQRQNYED